MKTFILYDESVSHKENTRVLLAGLDLNRFKKNPVMLYMHKRAHQGEAPAGAEVIGRWENIRIHQHQLLADAVFDRSEPFAMRIAAKVQKGFLKGASIGIDVQHSQKKEPQNANPYLEITQSQLLEASIVDIPQNENALVNQHVMYARFAYPPDLNKEAPQAKKETIAASALQKALGLHAKAGSAPFTPEALLERVEALVKKASSQSSLSAKAAKPLAPSSISDKEGAMSPSSVSAKRAGASFVPDKGTKETSGSQKDPLVSPVSQTGDAPALSLATLREALGLCDGKEQGGDEVETLLAHVRALRQATHHQFEEGSQKMPNVPEDQAGLRGKTPPDLARFLTAIQEDTGASSVDYPKDISRYQYLLRHQPEMLQTLQKHHPKAFQRLIETHLSWKKSLMTPKTFSYKQSNAHPKPPT